MTEQVNHFNLQIDTDPTAVHMDYSQDLELANLQLHVIHLQTGHREVLSRNEHQQSSEPAA